MMVARRSGAVVSPHRRLSREKGKHYGESHQKALQISGRMLPLVGVSGSGRERASCQASGPSARLGLCVCMPLLPCGWECVPLPTRRQCRKECDDLSGHEAAEISSATLLRRWKRCHWRSSSCLSIAPCGVGAHALYTVAQSIVKTATLEGGRCFVIRLPLAPPVGKYAISLYHNLPELQQLYRCG
jgi:hypothetical protein